MLVIFDEIDMYDIQAWFSTTSYLSLKINLYNWFCWQRKMALSMALSSTFFCLLFSFSLVSCQLLNDDLKTRRLRKGYTEEGRIGKRSQRSVSLQDDLECQEGNPPGVSYSGKRNITASGRSCQVWAAQQPHQHTTGTDLGEHNYCRNPGGGHTSGVWCYTTDPDKRWELCSVAICAPTMLKVFDFSADNDHEPDSNGKYTEATLNAGFLPKSFTICSAMMVEAWPNLIAADMFALLDVDGYIWGRINLYPSNSFTEYEAKLGPVFFVKQTQILFFPLQWSRACLSLDSNASKVRLVVDGQLLGEGEYKREEDEYRPVNLSLVLGQTTGQANVYEYPVKIANLNVFNSALTVERMVGLTRAGEEKCGKAGDLVNLVHCCTLS